MCDYFARCVGSVALSSTNVILHKMGASLYPAWLDWIIASALLIYGLYCGIMVISFSFKRSKH